jgi:DNA polymerase III subunit alpha
VGEKAIEDIIDERKKHGPYSSIFDLVKRVNQRTVNKKSLESLVYSGAFDCFKEHTRAQYFYQAPGDSVALEKIIKFGSIYQTQNATSTNTLFGDMQMPEVTPPKLLPCEPWPLIVQLDYEKEVTGMYMSGHPLDNYRFEMQFYNITPLGTYDEFKTDIQQQANPARSFRLAGLVIDAQHRLTKTGKNFGVLVLEDYSGKAEFMLWSEDYTRYTQYLAKGLVVMVEGSFRTRYNSDQYEFKIAKIHLLDTVKPMLTRQLTLELEPQHVNSSFIEFLNSHIKNAPGKTQLKVMINDQRNGYRFGLHNVEKNITINDELVQYLQNQPDIGVSVVAS